MANLVYKTDDIKAILLEHAKKNHNIEAESDDTYFEVSTETEEDVEDITAVRFII